MATFFQLLTIVVPEVVMAHAPLMYTIGTGGSTNASRELLGKKVEKFL